MKKVLFLTAAIALATSTFAQFELEASYLLSSPRSNFKTFHNALDGSGIQITGTIHRPDKKSDVQFALGFMGYTHSSAIASSRYSLQQSSNQTLPINVNSYTNDGSGLIYIQYGQSTMEDISENWQIGAAVSILGYALVMPDKSYSYIQASPDGNYFETSVSSTSNTAFDLGALPELIVKRKLAKNLKATLRGSWLISSSLFSDVEFEEDFTITSNGSTETDTRTNNVNLSALNVSFGISYTFGTE